MRGWQGSDGLNYFGVPHRLSEMPDYLREHAELVLSHLDPGVYHFKLDGVPVELTVTREPNDDVTFKLTPVPTTKSSSLWAKLTGRRPRPGQ